MARPRDLPEFPGLPVLACTFPIFENSGLPVLDGSDLPEIGGSTLSAIGGSAGLPDIGDMDHCVRVAKKPKLRDGQHMRVEGFPDIPSVGDRFGQDLVEVPAEWLNIELARCSLMERGIVQPKHAPLLFEVFAGCANLSRAAVGSGWQVCPPSGHRRSLWHGSGLGLALERRSSPCLEHNRGTQASMGALGIPMHVLEPDGTLHEEPHPGGERSAQYHI